MPNFYITGTGTGHGRFGKLQGTLEDLIVEAALAVSDRPPVIAAPLKLSECSRISDGAAAIVLSSADAADGAQHRVEVPVTCHVSDLLPLAARDALAVNLVGAAMANYATILQADRA